MRLIILLILLFVMLFPGTPYAAGAQQSMFNSWATQYLDIAQGTSTAPVTAAGPLMKVSRTEAMAKSTCNNNSVDNECNAAAAFYSVGTSANAMQTNAVLMSAQGSGTSDNVGLATTGRTVNTGVGIGTGAYIEGRRDTATGKQLGSEVRSNNYTPSAESYYPLGYNSGGLWVSASGLSKSACGACIGSAGQSFDVAFAATASSAVSQTFRDDGSAATSMQINGSHTYGLDLTSGVFSGAPILAPLSTPASSSDACKQGAIKWDASFLYVCAAANSWKRAALSAF